MPQNPIFSDVILSLKAFIHMPMQFTWNSTVLVQH